MAQQKPHKSRLGRLSWLNPSKWWAKLELDSRTVLMMLKGALAPTITIAICQSDAISNITTTIGYLSALISVLSQGLMPRAKFMKIMFFDLVSVCVSASLFCLAVFCSVKAREHNLPAGASESDRNGFSSDACAVSAIWLIFMIWTANSLRALRPIELQDPMVAFSIFASVTITRGDMFTTLTEGFEFISRLLKGFMIGFAIAAGVSLLILPITSRGNVFHDIKGHVTAVEEVLQSQISFSTDSSATGLFSEKGLLRRARTVMSTQDAPNEGESDQQTKQRQLQTSMTKLNGLHSKLHADLFYSKAEIAWGKLSADDLSAITARMRSLLLPLSGMSMLPEILEMIIKNEGPRGDDVADADDKGALKHSEIEKLVEMLHERLVHSSKLVTLGLHYFLLALELSTPKHWDRHAKSQLSGSGARDEEARGETLCPLQSDFPSRFKRELHRYYSRRKHLPETLASLEAFSGTENPVGVAPGPASRRIAADPDVRQEFFLILYIGHLQDDLLNATLQLVQFADSKIADGTMKRSRLIFPKQRSIRAWLFLSSDKKESETQSERRQSSNVDPSTIHRDSTAAKFPDPEHLPPENIWEKGSTVLRTISHAIKSEQSIFGFRVAAASFSVGILAFLHQTQDFFIRQRCIWAMIVIVIGMNPTSGQTMFGFIARIAATVISLVLSLVVWYIVDGKTAGVIVFLYIANVFEYYFYVMVPQYFGASIISIVTLNVIVGYELQVRKLGIPLAESNGQPYYPIYLFGPYKLAAVAAGCAISFFWVIFPYPITAKSQLRKLLGRSLFVLARFYSCMHATIELWLSNELGSIEDTHSPAAELQGSRHRVFKEEMMLLTGLRMHSHFSTFEPAVGGKFPKEIYDNIISEIQCILTSMSLMAHTTQSLDAFSMESDSDDATPDTAALPGNENRWKTQLSEIALASTDFNSHCITSLLCHLSASITNAQPLPPYLSTPDSFPLARQMQKIDDELLSIRHVADPAFSAFVSLEVLRSVVSFSLQDLLENVKKLVGELNFDLHFRESQRYAESSRLMSSFREG
ncbi:hypothetical protein NUU61_003557 [Penicillium alfredii]|uniref:ER transporter 6TM N-terminal domain-containing protein n=1 Tax=Penicillium alfredii TaxID=1506179 RepID=A0A9W9FJJ6_9EURO|nr:uncharacterized protein NUU61_003557 [Penicillium alfredii]KAJ5101335.1 hypothetical protein NUU61_003557 [Penicillium alfredii]